VGTTGLELSRGAFYEKELSLQVSCSYGPGRHDPSYEDKGHDYPLPYVRWTENRNMAEYLELLASVSTFSARAGVTYRELIELTSTTPKIYVLTNYAYPEYRRQCSLVGADGFFDKSAEYDSFLTALRAAA
jgi:hypothetical protein